MISAVELGKIAELIGAAAVSGIGVSLCFGLLILGATRAGDLSRAQRPRLAAAFAALAVVAGLGFAGGVAFGITIIAS